MKYLFMISERNNHMYSINSFITYILFPIICTYIQLLDPTSQYFSPFQCQLWMSAFVGIPFTPETYLYIAVLMISSNIISN